MELDKVYVSYCRINIVLGWQVAPHYVNKCEYSGMPVFMQGLKTQSEYTHKKGPWKSLVMINLKSKCPAFLVSHCPQPDFSL